ncbi:hypothetical protein BDV29DRAFT_152657 [Aspergillus leporis]|uniref:Uncharacterized protein n=1 Tax=Aspergillus leporis TaxID=41062 RepID=A0A5N5XGB4_9EURO|nr:hypothetical protein BDV29DRAFT_152657 [Aspergillus leporis]
MDDKSLIEDGIEELDARLSDAENRLDLSQLTPTETETQGSESSEADELSRKYRALKADRRALDIKRRQIFQQNQNTEFALTKLQTQSGNMKATILRECIEARNNYSKVGIKNDFASGIRQLDLEPSRR